MSKTDVLEGWTPERAVPEFDLQKAAGNPGHWNNLTPVFNKMGASSRKPQLYYPLILHAKPDHAMLQKFLDIRKNSKGESLLQQCVERLERAYRRA